MSEYYWTCPGCSSAVYWGDDAYYSEELDDNICAECYNIDQTEKQSNME